MQTLLDTGSRPDALERRIDDHRVRVLANDWLNDEYKLLRLDAPEAAGAAEAGQFFNLECPSNARERPFLRRPMSVYEADARAGSVSFLYKVTGAGTRSLAALSPGDETRILGPLGVGFKLQSNWRSIVMLGRGVGLATLAPLADLATSRNVAVTAILSARGPAHVMSLGRFASGGAQTEIVLDSDGASAPDQVEIRLRRLHREGRADAFFTCGSNRLMLLMQRLGRELGIPGQVALEQQMACGLGMCFCCVRDFTSGAGVVSRRVCWDGPVFDLHEALPCRI